MTIQSTEPPCSVAWFQHELDRACADRHIALRIKWSPSLTVARVNGRIFKKYPDPTQEFQDYLKGYFVLRNGARVGYQTPSGILTGVSAISPGDVLERDVERIQLALPFFVIEQRRNEESARRLHAQHRYVSVEGYRFDALGEFPPEGWWDWWDDVSEHREGCCDMKGPHCRGVFREPNHEDLLRVKKALWVRSQMPQLRGPSDEPTAREINQWAKAQEDKKEEFERKFYDDLTQELGENIALCLRPTLTPSVYVNLRSLKGQSNVSNR